MVVKVQFNKDYISVSRLIFHVQSCFANYMKPLIIKRDVEKKKENRPYHAVVKIKCPVLVKIQYVLTSVRPLVRPIECLVQENSGGVVVVHGNSKDGGRAHLSLKEDI